MRTESDFSTSRKNPYAKPLKRQITIHIDTAAVEYFKQMAAELGIPYQNLINLFLRDCAIHKRRPTLQWPEDPAGSAISLTCGTAAAPAARTDADSTDVQILALALDMDGPILPNDNDFGVASHPVK